MDTRPRGHPLPDMWSSVLDSKEKTSLQVRGRDRERWGRQGGRDGERKRREEASCFAVEFVR